MRGLVLGLGVSGRAVCDFCRARGDTVLCYDDRLCPEEPLLEGIDFVVKSPGFPLTHPLVKKVVDAGIPLQGEVDLALAELHGRKGVTLYGITGSNGKTTTTLLAAHLLRAAGKRVVAAGNIGKPLLSCIQEEVDYVVIELSSFQLETIQPLPVLDGALILNITPNHLDYHSSFAAYAEAKLRLRHLLKEGAPFYVGRAVAENFLVPGTIFDLETISPLGYREGKIPEHERQNRAAAAALTGVAPSVVREAVKTFTKPPHRLERVRTHGGLTFINDSKATSVDAVAHAVQAVEGPIQLIAGGVDKGGAYVEWVPLFKEKVRKLFVMGQASARMYAELSPFLEVEKVSSLEEGVRRAVEEARGKGTILLSPGCSSYDQFANYEERGEIFKKVVDAL